MDLSGVIEKKRERFAALEKRMAEADFYDDKDKAAEVFSEHKNLQKLLHNWQEWQEVLQNINDNEELISSEDAEMAEMAKAENEELAQKSAKLELQIQYAVLPRDPDEEHNVIVEIRAGTGGDEAGIFVGDLLRMYSRFGEISGLKIDLLEASPNGVGGFKDVTFKAEGDEVFRLLKYESGVHRVQRVPATETQGRIHTSTATVAVLPEAKDVELHIAPDDLRIETCRAGGPGGQHVNTTDSAVQILHIPTGIMVRCQDGRSQGKNKEKAMTILRSKLYENKKREEEAKYSAQRRDQIGSGGREEKIRTYNFPQNRLTDHRISLTLYNLEAIIEGEVSPIIEALQRADIEQRIANAEENS